MQTAALQGSMLHWCRDHRVHRFSDTPADPHDATRGLFYSHVGCFLMKKDPRVIAAGKKLDLSDLRADRLVWLQHRIYSWFGPTVCFLLPALVARAWGEQWWTGILLPGLLRYVWVLHTTWTINSLCHFWGGRAYDPSAASRDNPIAAFFALGEGWHNYHHAFAFDYATAELGALQQYNPTKVFLDACALGLVGRRQRGHRLWALKQEHARREGTRGTRLSGPPLFQTRTVWA